MLVMGIESSCDDTGVAVLKDGKEPLANLLSSQVKIHSIFGGVVPELAARKHLDNILPLTHKALSEAGISLSDIDCIGVTNRPGLVPSLLVGLTFAKGLSFGKDIPLIGVNHLEAHAFAVFLEREVEFPFVCLVVSGGHTNLFLVEDYGVMKLLGKTLDDAAGEAFDKVAKLLGLGYPGGPVIDAISKKGDPSRIRFPVSRVDGYNFSFSGVKTAVMMYLKRENPDLSDEAVKADIAASFQEAVVKALVEKTLKAASDYGVKSVVVSGGVACNSRLREAFCRCSEELGISCHFPSPGLCTDNALMVAYVASYRFERGERDALDLDAFSRI